jgi:hypothetical protein
MFDSPLQSRCYGAAAWRIWFSQQRRVVARALMI